MQTAEMLQYCTLLFLIWCLINAADTVNESTESDDEFQICEICNSEEVKVYNCLDVFKAWFVSILYCTHCLTAGKKEITPMLLLWSTGSFWVLSPTYYRCSTQWLVMSFMQGKNRGISSIKTCIFNRTLEEVLYRSNSLFLIYFAFILLLSEI